MITLILVLFVLAIGAGLWWRTRQHRTGVRFRRLLKEKSEARVSELYIPDGMDGQIHVPHVVRTHAGFVVLDVVRVHGAVFGGDQIDEWTVLVSGQSRKFRNPVATNRLRVLAVKALVPGVPVHGLVVLLGNVSFPKGCPETVVTVDTLAGKLAALPFVTPATGDWNEAWYGLAACASARQDSV